MDNFNINDDNEITKSSLRKKADRAKKLRSRSLICVLENPANVANVAAVIRNIDALGVTKLYVVTQKDSITSGKSKKKCRILNKVSSSSSKYVYVRYFQTTKSCYVYLEKKRVTSLVTSPHFKGETNYELMKTDFTKFKKLAVWFGNESEGISDEAIAKSNGCVQIEMAGIIESMNLSVATGIVLHHIAYQRRYRKNNRNLMKQLGTSTSRMVKK